MREKLREKLEKLLRAQFSVFPSTNIISVFGRIHTKYGSFHFSFSFCYFLVDAADAFQLFDGKQTRFSHFPLMRRIISRFPTPFTPAPVAVDDSNSKFKPQNGVKSQKSFPSCAASPFAFCLSHERLLELKSNLVGEFFIFHISNVLENSTLPYEQWNESHIHHDELFLSLFRRSSPPLSLSFCFFRNEVIVKCKMWIR